MTGVSEPLIGADALATLDAEVRRALASRDTSALSVLGYGEISTVLGWPVDAPRVACKLLPPMTRAQLAAYRQVLSRYLDTLGANGVIVPRSEVHTVRRPDGVEVGYVVQPVLPGEALAPRRLAAAAPRPDHPLLLAVIDAVRRTVSDRVGLDAQLSNWALVDGTLWYLDVTTPMLRDAAGREQLDLEPVIGSVPAALRPAVRRFVAPDILARYYALRPALRDLAANLHKERLTDWIPAVLKAANAVVDEPLTAAEVADDYHEDARTWALMQRLRRADRAWQRGARRRTYPFLLPGRIDR